ncbi:hypothetical protein TH66_20560 [Carbonactinospora thermoautotrophica]|uniref:ORC1/DEAH AAA+ ATPase domain-containing protein n=2 Tax=Carbonactinospora thermoautotrophica TaxID=1469144 RepID=A0A132ML08_9ACTN|nr:AAA family ATPase [Carbonactinospora thermoautotrophica]KWW97829.1 hypothetical protein TH66_20560 [Carbonactinospora thermoautotrophica]KWW98435.1 hypothetical protein LI90_55 [Carbonactinospora thermoautotrophica]
MDRTEGTGFPAGRERALATLSGWLADPDDRAVVVTGAPGTGKTTLLAWLVGLTDPEWRAMHAALPAPPPENAFHAVVAARGGCVETIAWSLARQLGHPYRGPRAFLQELAADERPAVLMISELDQVGLPWDRDAETERVAREFLAPLAELEHVRLLLDGSATIAAALGDRAGVVDLDSPEFTDRAAFTAWAGAAVGASTGKGADDPQVAVAAEAIARAAYPNFLLAELLAADLAVTGEVGADAGDVRARLRTVLDRYLASRTPAAPRARDVLGALAFADPAGVPLQAWPTLVAAVTGRPCSAEDVETTLRHAGDLVAVSAETGWYRLRHHSFAEELAGRRDAAEVCRRLVDAFRVPASDAAGYARRALPGYAATAGQLPELLADPAFLVDADPGRLQAALARAHPAGPVRHAWDQGADQLLSDRRESRAAQLSLTARCQGAHDLADGIAALQDLPWTVRWARWLPRGATQSPPGWPGRVQGLAVVDDGSGPVAVCGNTAGRLHRLDLASGDPAGPPVRTHVPEVLRLAAWAHGGRVLAAVMGPNPPLELWDLTNGEALGGLAGLPWYGVSGGFLKGEPVLALGAPSGVVHLWNPVDMTLRGQLVTGEDGTVVALAFTGAGTTLAATNSGGNLYAWDVESGRLAARPGAHHGIARSVAVGMAGGVPVVVSGGSDGTVQVWNLDTGELSPAPSRHLAYVSATAVATVAGQGVAASASRDGLVRLWRLADGDEPGVFTVGHQVHAMALCADGALLLGTARGVLVVDCRPALG